MKEEYKIRYHLLYLLIKYHDYINTEYILGALEDDEREYLMNLIDD